MRARKTKKGDKGKMVTESERECVCGCGEQRRRADANCKNAKRKRGPPTGKPSTRVRCVV